TPRTSSSSPTPQASPRRTAKNKGRTSRCERPGYGMGVTRWPADGAPREASWDYPYTACSPACANVAAERHNPRLGGWVLSVRAKEASHDDNTGRRAECSGGQQDHAAPVAAA